MNSESNRMVACPTCKKKIVYSKDNPHRPFCSERCKTLDLGAWADEHYRIPLQVTSAEDADSQGDSVKSSQNDDESL